MYTVKLGNDLLYDPRVDELEIFEPRLTLEINTTGSFVFKIYPSHPLYNQIKRLTSVIEVYQDNSFLFRGRVLNDEHDFYNAKKIICEGDLGFFNDSIIRPYEYSGTVSGYVKFIIDKHNEQVDGNKQFTLGNVTVTDPNDYIVRSSVNPVKSWTEISDKLIGNLGGYFMVRRSGNINYIDYLDDSNRQSLQQIKLGENLLDLKKDIRGENIVTAIIPYGARIKDSDGNETDERLTIESETGGIDYVYDQPAVDKYGWIFDTVIFDDVTVASNLVIRGNTELARRINIDVSIELSAIDLSMTNADIDDFRIFEYVEVDSPAHLLEEYMLVSRLELDLINPSNNKLTLGIDYATFTDMQVKTEQAIKGISVIKGPKGDVGPAGPEGQRGLRGLEGPKGDQGIKGPKGDDGESTYTHLAYATGSSGQDFSVVHFSSATYIGMYTSNQSEDSTDYRDYNWNLIKGADGSQGVQGPRGEDGQTPYFHTAWANNSNGTSGFSTTDSTNKLYIGTYTDFTQASSNNPSEYSWTRIKGEKGDKGDIGPQGVPGPKGIDGQTLYTWVKYADTPTSGMSNFPDGKAYIGLAYNKVTPTESSTYSDYTWSKVKGEDGIPGSPGSDGQTTYTWVKYADTETGAGMSDSPTNKRFIGLAFNKTTPIKSTNASDYSWSPLYDNLQVGGMNLIVSNFLVPSGAVNTEEFTLSGWAAVLLNQNDTQSILSEGETYTLSYECELIERTSAPTLHSYQAGFLLYSQTGQNVSFYSGVKELGETEKVSVTFVCPTLDSNHRILLYTNRYTTNGVAPIGTDTIRFRNFKLEHGNVATDWTPAPEDVNQNIIDTVESAETRLNANIEVESDIIRTEVEEQFTSKSEFQTYQNDVSTEFTQTKDTFNFQFTELEQWINTVDGDTQAEFEEISKYIRFINGNIELGEVGNPIMLTIENDIISFRQNGVVVAYFANNSLYVTDGRFLNSIRIGEFQFTPRSNGNLSFGKVN